MGFREPTNDEIREILLSAPYFEWPTFDHMPLNCFDLTSAVLTFPGDISQCRTEEPSIYAKYAIDIGDLSTCPKKDEIFDVELWNEKSVCVAWFFGRFNWACMIDVGEFVLRQGYFSVGVAVARFQHIQNVADITNFEQLKLALLSLLAIQIENEDVQPLQENSIFSKEINGRHWLIARSLNHANNPCYSAVSPIDHQTAIYIPASLRNCWFYGEVIPDSVEQKHLASLWDFLGHIHLTYEHNGDLAVGSVAREAPGQAEKVDDLPEW